MDTAGPWSRHLELNLGMHERIDLETLSSDDLIQLRQTITETLDARRPGTGITIQRYEFDHNYAPARQPKPSVAKLTLGADCKIERSFYEIPKTGQGTQRVRLHGWYEAADFDLIEEEYSTMSEGKSVLHRSICIAFRGELCEVSLPNRDVSEHEISEYLGGNRAALLPFVQADMESSKRHTPNHPYVLVVEGLFRELQSE